MIYEVRTYRLKPRGVPEFIKIFGKAYEKRKNLSKLSAFFSQRSECSMKSYISGLIRMLVNGSENEHGQ